MSIKPIETVYNGYHFRSRLEARWAVFFDAAGIEYEYEPEGFELEDGTKYLPDFYFPEYDWYAEVKAPRDNAADEIEKASRFVGGKIRVLILLGNIPDECEMPVYHFCALHYDYLSNEVLFERVCFIPEGADNEPCSRIGFCGHFYIDRQNKENIFQAKRNMNYWLTAIPDKEMYTKAGENLCWSYGLEQDKETMDFLVRCYSSARQARFEHGEKPIAKVV